MGKQREYTVDGRCAEFNKTAFWHWMKEKSRQKHISMERLEAELAEILPVTAEAIHKWYQKNGGGPGDYGLVRKLAEAMGLEDCTRLLTFKDDGGTEMEYLTDRQKRAAKRIYDICIWFLHEFDRTEGFQDYWLRSRDAGSEDPEKEIREAVEGMMRKINLTLDQEYFDLRDTQLYNELCEFVSEELFGIYNEKLSRDYRRNAPREGHPTVSQDYDKAMIRLNTILDKYL